MYRKLLAGVSVAVLLVLVSSTVHAADLEYRAGKYWKSQTFTQKLNYLQGFVDALSMEKDAKEMELYLGDEKNQMLMADAIIGLDKIYADDASKRLPIGAALMLLQVKRKGGSSEGVEAMRDEMLRIMDEASNPKPIEGKVQ